MIEASIFGIGLLSRVWYIDKSGISYAAGTVPYWDFANLWTGTKLATTGHLAILSDTDAYRHAMATLLKAPIKKGEWIYPPTMLLVGIPFAQFSIGVAYLIWTCGTIALYALAVRALRLSPLYSAFAILSPALIWNVALGQNGALTGALLLAGLIQVDRRPNFGGFLLGCLVIKPHLAILVPFALIAQRNWRALTTMSVTALGLVILSAAVFGWSAWQSFFVHTGPMMRETMEATFPQGYQVRAITVFILARALGLAVGTSYIAQAISAVLAIVVVIWSTRWPITWQLRLALTISLTYLAVPYGYTYDMLALSASIAALIHQNARENEKVDLLAVAVWLIPIMPMLKLPHILLPLAPVILAFLVIRLLIIAKSNCHTIANCSFHGPSQQGRLRTLLSVPFASRP